MKANRFAGAVLLGLLFGVPVLPLSAGAADEALATAVSTSPYYRVFLNDGTSIVSYGEMARVADRVVFSMPTSTSLDHPELQLVDIPSRRVDWVRTESYSEAARATHYFATRADIDYARLSADIESALNHVAFTTDPLKRLEIVEKARKALSDWPASHYGYKQNDVREMLRLMDEAILDLRAAAGARKFQISLVTTAMPPIIAFEPLLPPPTPKEAIEQTLAVAAMAESPAERVSLLTAARVSIERDRETLPFEWANAVGVTTSAAIAKEVETDRTYQALSIRVMNLAAARARAADVKGVAALIPEIESRDLVSGKARPDTVTALLTAVQDHLDAARRLKLARDRWALRLPELRAYQTSVAGSFQRLTRLRTLLEDIKSLAGATPEELNTILSSVVQIQRAASVLIPPEELRETHSLLLSATELTENAAKIRRQAVLSNDMARAWDASSAAAGALMLSARAEAELQAALRMPQLPR
jgi:hypothetical protein